MKKIIYTAADGRMCVVNPVINTHTMVDGVVVPVPENISEAEAVERAFGDIPADATDVTVVDEVPADRTFRNAWTATKDGVDVDMGKAADIHRDRLRELRAPFLADLDIEFMRAIEAGDTKATAEIAAKKQALRDVTEDPAIEAAQTPEELKAVMPEALQL